LASISADKFTVLTDFQGHRTWKNRRSGENCCSRRQNRNPGKSFADAS